MKLHAGNRHVLNRANCLGCQKHLRRLIKAITVQGFNPSAHDRKVIARALRLLEEGYD